MNIKPFILTCLGVTFAAMHIYILATGDKCKLQDLIQKKSELSNTNNHIYILGIEGVLPVQNGTKKLNIQLNGTKGSSHQISVKSPNTCNYYVINTTHCLGDITHVEVEFNNGKIFRDPTRLLFIYDEKHKKSYRFRFSPEISEESTTFILDTKIEKALLLNWNHNWIAFYNKFPTTGVGSQGRVCVTMANMICAISILERLPPELPDVFKIGLSIVSSASLTFFLDSYVNVCKMAALPPLEITNSQSEITKNQVSCETQVGLGPHSVDDLKSLGNLSNNEPHKEEEMAESDSETESVLRQKSLRFRDKSSPLRYKDHSLIRPSRRLPEENLQSVQGPLTNPPMAANGDRARMGYRFSEVDTRQSTTTDSSVISNSFHSVPDLTKGQVYPLEMRSPSKFLLNNREYMTFPLRTKEVIATRSIEPDFSKSDLETTAIKSIEEIKSPSDNVIVTLDPEEKKAFVPVLMYDQGLNILLYSREISVVEMTKEEQMKHFVDLFTHLKKAKEHVLAAWQILLGGIQYSDVWPSDDTSSRFRSNKRFRKVIHELERVMTVLQIRRPDESVGKLVKQRAKSDIRIIQLKRSRSTRSTSRFSLITLLNMDSVLPNILLNMAVQLVVIVLDSLKDFHKSSVTTKFHVSGSVLFDLKAIVRRFCMEIQTILEYFDRSMTRCRSKRSEVYLVNHAIPSQRPSIVLFKSGLRTKSLTDLDSLKAPVLKPALRRCKSATLCDLTTWNPLCPQPSLDSQDEQSVLLLGPPPSFELLPVIENQFLERIIEAVRKMLFREPACVSLGDVIRVRMLYHEMGFVEACKDFVSELLDTVTASVHASTVELFGLKNERRLKMNIADEMGILLTKLFDELATDIAMCKRPERSLLLPLPLGTISVLQKYLHDAVIRNYAPKSLPGSIVSLRSEEMMLAALLQDYCEDRKVPFPLVYHIHAHMQAFLWKILTAQRILRELEIKFSKFVIEDIMLRGVYDTIREVETIHQIGESKEELLHALSKVDKLYYIEPLDNTENTILNHPGTGDETVAESVPETDLFTDDQLRDIHSEMCGSVVPVAPPWCRTVALTAIGLEIATATVFAVSNGLGDTPTQGLAMVTTLAVALILDAVVFQPLKCAFLAHWNAHRKRKWRNRQASSELNTMLIIPI